jgi:hypothetical protein
MVTPIYDKWSARNDPRPYGSVKRSALAMIRLVDDPCAIVGW